MSTKSCASCGKPFEAKRATAKFCGERCRKRAQRGSGGGTVVAFGVVPVPAGDRPPEPHERGPGPLEKAALTELEAVGRAETLAGVMVLALARRIDRAGPLDSGTAFAALTKELRAALAAAVAGADQEDDPVDQVRKQREQKQRERGRTG